MTCSTTDVTRHLPSQLLEVLRDRTMTLPQLSTYYGMKYRSNLADRLKGAKANNLLEYLRQFGDLFDVVDGSSVRAKAKRTVQQDQSSAPAPPGNQETQPTTPIATIRYAHISKALQKLLNESPEGGMEIGALEAAFLSSFAVSLLSIIGMPTEEYLSRKTSVFIIDNGLVRLQPAFQIAPAVEVETKEGKAANKPESSQPAKPIPEKPVAASWADEVEDTTAEVKPETQPVKRAAEKAVKAEKSETLEKSENNEKAENNEKGKGLPLFVIDELVRIFEEHSEGPIMHSSVLCSLFMQCHGSSVTEVSGRKPMELFRHHSEVFLWLSSGNVALTKNREDRAVQQELRLLNEQPKKVRVQVAAAEAALPVPEHVSEQDVIDYMVGLLNENAARESIYISALCGRFMQRFRRPVTDVVGCKPTDFLKRHSDVFYFEKGGHVRLVNGAAGADSGKERVACVQAAAVVGNGEEKSNAGQGTRQGVKGGDVRTNLKPSQQLPEPAQVVQQANGTGRRRFDVGNRESRDALIQRVERFCAKLKEGLFFKVVEVAIESKAAAALADLGKPLPLELPVRVAVSSMPGEIQQEWAPQLLIGLQQVAELRVDGMASQVKLEAEGVRCLLSGNPPIQVLVWLDFVTA